MSDSLEAKPLVVNETPYCIWGGNLTETNRRFITSIDTDYYRQVAQVHTPLLNGEQDRYAALMLRFVYSHALENLFALVGATIQAPNAVAGWLSRYTSKDLLELVRKIQLADQNVLNILGMHQVTWDAVAKLLIPIDTTHDSIKSSQIQEAFSAFWSRLAQDFLSPALRNEYNSIKHGLRVTQGGFGFKTEPDWTAEEVRLFRGSQYGSMSFHYESLTDKTNLRAIGLAMNWSPTQISQILHLISASFESIVGFLKWYNQMDVSEPHVELPELDFFTSPWDLRAFPTSVEIHDSIEPSGINPLSKEEILSLYRNVAKE